MGNLGRRFIPSAAIVVVLLATSAVSLGRLVAMARNVPVAQALANVDAWIKSHPKDAAGYRTLGFVHALAWGYGEEIPLVSAGGPEALPAFAETTSVLVTRSGPGEPQWDGKAWHTEARKDRPITAADAQHLADSIAAYRKAIALDPDDALSELGLGWMTAQQGEYAQELPADYFGAPKASDTQRAVYSQAIRQLADENPAVRDAASKTLAAAMPGCLQVLQSQKPDNPEAAARIDAVLLDYFRLQALEHDRRAFELRVDADMKGDPTYQTDSQVSAKAGQQIEHILAKHPEAAKGGEISSVQKVLDALQVKVDRLNAMPQ